MESVNYILCKGIKGINIWKKNYLKYFTRIKFSEFCQKDFLHGARFFNMRLKKGIYRANQRLDFCNSKILNFYGN